ncbi:26021_t:CDS:2, partial [Gigaspora rosea]
QRDIINTLAPKVELLKISIYKRKKEWVVFKNKGILEFGKIVRKSDKSWIEIEHWQTKIDESAYTTRLKKCKGYQINEGTDSSKLQSILRRQLRSKKRALQNNWVKKAKETVSRYPDAEKPFRSNEAGKTLVRLKIIRGVISLEKARKVADLTGKKKGAKKEEKEGITKDNKHKSKEAEKKTKTDPVKKRRKGKEKQTLYSEA